MVVGCSKRTGQQRVSFFLADESSTTNWSGCNFSWNFDQWFHTGFTYSQAEQLAKFYVDGVNVCSNVIRLPSVWLILLHRLSLAAALPGLTNIQMDKLTTTKYIGVNFLGKKSNKPLFWEEANLQWKIKYHFIQILPTMSFPFNLL